MLRISYKYISSVGRLIDDPPFTTVPDILTTCDAMRVKMRKKSLTRCLTRRMGVCQRNDDFENAGLRLGPEISNPCTKIWRGSSGLDDVNTRNAVPHHPFQTTHYFFCTTARELEDELHIDTIPSTMAKVFSLKGQALKLDTAADLEKHVAPLRDSKDVEEVHLEGNTIGVEASEALAKILETKTTLQVANLADIFTGRLLSEIPQALDALLKALLKLPNLHTINLNDNAFGLNTVEPLRPFLSQHTPLQHLYLNNNGLGPAAGTLVAEALASLAEKKEQARNEGKDVPHLETVVCGRNRLETGSMEAWVKAYKANNKVKTVKMVQNGIRQEGIAKLLQHGLSGCTALETLDLQDNTFTVTAANTLANVVHNWTEVRELGVGDSLLGARGGRRLGEALAKGNNKKLEVLRLQYNEIDAKGIKALTDAATSTSALPRLRRVELNGNKFSEEDPNIEILQTLLSKRKDESAADYHHVDEDDEDAWGMDELDELDDEDEDEEDEEEIEEQEEAEKVVKDAEVAENEPVAQEKDKEVDELANALGKTELK
jgi:Ran GTPase-activating protein 1